MSVLSQEQRLRVLAALVDGSSERAVERMTGVSRPSISKLALRLGAGAAHLHNVQARDLSCSLIEADEIWSYVGKKQARVDPAKDGPDVGEAYTFVGLAMPARYVVAWKVGKRDQETTDAFVADLRSRLVVMPAMTSDGFVPYVSAIGQSFGPGVDYAQTVKNYRSGAARGPDHRYEPARDPFITKRAVYGAPDIERRRRTPSGTTGRCATTSGGCGGSATPSPRISSTTAQPSRSATSTTTCAGSPTRCA